MTVTLIRSRQGRWELNPLLSVIWSGPPTYPQSVSGQVGRYAGNGSLIRTLFHDLLVTLKCADTPS